MQHLIESKGHASWVHARSSIPAWAAGRMSMGKTGLNTALVRPRAEVMLLLTSGAAQHALVKELRVRPGHHLMRSRIRKKTWDKISRGWGLQKGLQAVGHAYQA